MKSRNPECGSYCITDTVTGETYVGETNDLRRRLSEHKTKLRNHTSGIPRLQEAWDRDGETAFVFTVIERCDEDELKECGQRAMDCLKPTLNIAPFARSAKDVPRTAEWNLKIGQANKSRQGQRHWLGRHHSDETKTKLSAIAKKRVFAPRTAESRARSSAALKAFWQRQREHSYDVRGHSVGCVSAA